MPFAVDLCEYVADLVDSELLIEFDIGNLILLCQALDVLAERRPIFGMQGRLLALALLADLLSFVRSFIPMLFVSVHPLVQCPPTFADNGRTERYAPHTAAHDW